MYGQRFGVVDYRMFQQNSGEGGGGSEQEQQQQQQQSEQQQSDIAAQIAALPKEVREHYGALIAGARKEGRTAAEQSAAEREQQAQAERDREAQIKRGEFDQAAEGLKSERDAARSERDQYKQTLADYDEALKGRLDELKTGMTDLELDGFPESDTVIKQIKWLESRRQWLEKMGVTSQRKDAGTGPETPERQQGPRSEELRKQEQERLAGTGNYAV